MPSKIGGGRKLQSYDSATGKYGYGIEAKEKGLIQSKGAPVLTACQKKVIKNAENQIADHLRQEEYEAVIKELSGIQIKSKTGYVYDHISEVKESLTGLKHQCDSLKGSLMNPKLPEQIHKYLSRKLKQYRSVYNKFMEVMKGEKI